MNGEYIGKKCKGRLNTKTYISNHDPVVDFLIDRYCLVQNRETRHNGSPSNRDVYHAFNNLLLALNHVASHLIF